MKRAFALALPLLPLAAAPALVSWLLAAAPAARAADEATAAAPAARAADEATAAAAHARVPGVPDVPEGPGTLTGRIVHTSRPEAAAGLPVVLYALPPDGTPGLRGGVSDAHGEFRFEGVSTDPATPYLVGVSFAEVPFGVRVSFAEGRSEREVVLEISDPSDDVSAVGVGEVRLRFERGCGGLHVVESHALENPTPNVIAVGPDAREGHRPVFETALPAGATGFSAGAGSQSGLELEGERLRFWGPLYPGGQALEFSYAVPGTAAGIDVRRVLASGASRVVVVTHAEGPRVRSAGLRPGEVVEEGGGTWQTAARDGVAPGEELAFSVELPAAEPAPPELTLAQTRIWLELDEAALKVDERYELEVAGAAPLASRSDAPLLCVTLPDGAQELRFSAASLGMGLSPDPSGALAVRGPLPAGTSHLALSYLLPGGSEAPTLVRRFPLPFPVLSLFVADTGVVVDSPRLHQRRPVLTEDRTYLHFEGFAIGGDEAVSLSLRPLAARRRAPPGAGAAFLVLAALASVAVLSRPLRRGSSAAREATSAAALERESVYAAIRDLDHDFETGKLSEADYEAFRGELRARAVALLREERSREQAPPPAEPQPLQCPACGTAVGSDARFCSQCGAALGGRRRGGERVRSA
jgi:hypothetical protein